MSDFFEEESTATESTQEEKIKVGESEYSQEDLSRLVGLGKLAEESESRFNTKIDRVWPEFTKNQNELKQLREEKEQWESQKKQQEEVPEDLALQQARQAAKKVGIVTDDLFEDLLDKSFRQRYVRERAAEKLLDEAADLENKYNGSDGRPKFNSDEILQHMQDTGIRSPEKAYKDRYEPQLDAWKEQQLRQANRPGLVTNTTTTAGGKVPPVVKITKENINELVAQGLRGEL